MDKRKKKEESQKEKRKENHIEGERKKDGEKKRRFFSAFRQSNLNDPRVKVDPRNKGYAWVQKSRSFVKLQEVGNFLTWIISSLKSI